jgi:hypothetical protein
MDVNEKVDRIIDFIVTVLDTYNARLKNGENIGTFSGSWIDRLNNGSSIHMDLFISNFKIEIVNSNEAPNFLDFFIENQLTFYIFITELTVEKFTEELKKYALHRLKDSRNAYYHSSRSMEDLLELTGGLGE